MAAFAATYPSRGIHSGNPRSLKVHQIKGILLLLGIIVCAFCYKLAATPKLDPSVRLEQILYEQEQIRLQRATLPRNAALKFYGAVSLLSAINLSLLILAIAIARAKLRQASICSVRIGEHSAIPVRYHDLPRFYPIAQNLSQAELEASVSASHAKADQITRQMVHDVTNYTRARAGTFTKDSQGDPALGLGHTALPLNARGFAPPSVAELLRTGTLAPGKPLVVGYALGQPQYRELQDLKSVAVAGWQGSGKTRSMAYLIAAAVVTQDVQVFVVDPHKDHPESLATLIAPLVKTGRVTVMNPFDTPELITRLNNILDRRLSGQEASAPGILLVIDELARLAKLDYFADLITLLERCTEETRKANITFLGGSSKWTARHFKGRADIRGCMNSLLIHKTKPSQADLLLEDAQDKKLVKQVQRPGEAILVTDYAAPVVVSIPLCTRQDMAAIAEMIGPPAASSRPPAADEVIGNWEEQDCTTKHTQYTQHTNGTKKDGRAVLHGGNRDKKPHTTQRQRKRQPQRKSKTRRLPQDVIPLASQRQKHPAIVKLEDLTRERIIEQIQYRKQQEKGVTQANIARWAGMSPSLLSRILNGHTALTDEHKQKLFGVLFDEAGSAIQKSVTA